VPRRRVQGIYSYVCTTDINAIGECLDYGIPATHSKFQKMLFCSVEFPSKIVDHDYKGI